MVLPQLTSYLLYLTSIGMLIYGYTISVERNKLADKHIKHMSTLKDKEAMCNHDNSPTFPNINPPPGTCIITHMGLQAVPSNLPKNITILDLSYNHINEISNSSFPQRLALLYELKISHNKITSLDAGAFRNLNHLRVLDLSYNLLQSPEYFPENVFSPLANSLKTLYLHGDNMMSIPSTALSKLTSLISLVLDGPANIMLGKGFSLITSLQNLSFGYNGTSCITHYINNDTFQFVTSNLKVLNMSHCSLRHISNVSFARLKKLTHLDLCHNYHLNLSIALSALRPMWNSFQYIGLGSVNPLVKSEHWSELGPSNTRLNDNNTVHLLKLCIWDLDLSNNSLVYINATLVTNTFLNCLKNLKLNNNVLNGSQNTFDLLTRLAGSGSLKTIDLSMQRKSLATGFTTIPTNTYRNYRRLELSSVIKLPVPSSLTSANLNGFITTEDTDMFDTYEFHGTEALSSIDFSNNDIRCTKALIGLEKITSLRMSNNDCYKLNISIFKAAPKLKYLWIDDCDLHEGLQNSEHQQLLRPLGSLQYLSMARNGVMKLDHRFFKKSPELIYINLSGNNLTAVQPEWLHLPLIEEIDVSFNSITSLDTAVRDKLDALTANRTIKIHLKGNILSCACENLEFVKWTSFTKVVLDNEHGYPCILPNGTMSNTRYVHQELGDLEIRCLSSTILTTVVGFTIPSIVILVLVSVFYRHRWTLQYMWWKIKMQWSVNVRLIETSDGIIYDLFVMYSHCDTEWVVKVLKDKIEDQLGFKISFYGRNFLPGQYIKTEVISNLCSSRGSLFVITKDYLESEYSAFETRMVALRAVDKQSHKVFIILKDDIPVEKLPYFFRNMWNRVVCLPWTEDERSQEELWRKLEKALKRNRPPVLDSGSEDAQTHTNPESGPLPEGGAAASATASATDDHVMSSQAWFEDVTMGQDADSQDFTVSSEESDRKYLL